MNLGSLRDEDGGKNNSKYTTLRPQRNAQTQEAISNPQNKHGDQRVEFTITVTKKNMQEAAMQVWDYLSSEFKHAFLEVRHSTDPQ